MALSMWKSAGEYAHDVHTTAGKATQQVKEKPDGELTR